MPTFPLPKLPDLPFDTGGRKFGVVRKPDDPKQKAHAACDLLVAAGTEVYAVANGIVHMAAYEFIPTRTLNIQALEIWHTALKLLIRYGEIAVAKGLNRGVEVKEGQVIGTVAVQSPSMLHIEMFGTNERSNLSQNSKGEYDNVEKKNYSRRHDLLDPTPYLHQWKGNLKSAKGWKPGN